MLFRCFQDITERKQTALELEQAAAQRQQLLDFSQTLLSTLSVDEVIELTRSALENYVPYDTFAFFWLDETTNLLHLMAER